MSNEIDDKNHSEVGGSGASRWVNCPGSVFLARSLPKLPAGKAAEVGTESHKLAEIAVLDLIEEKLNGAEVLREFNKVKKDYDDEQIAAALGYREAIWSNVLQNSITGKACATEEELYFDEHLSSFGTADFWSLGITDKGKRQACVGDFKYGYHEVKCKGNAQLAFYAVALRRFFKAHGKDIDECKTFIYQPRQQVYPDYQEETLSAKQLDVWEKKFEKALHQIYVVQKPKLKTGEHCRWCPAQQKCPKYVKELEAKSALKLIDVHEIILPSPETIPDETLSNIIRYGDAIIKFVKACKGFALNRHAVGKPLPGLKVVEGKPRRKWKSDTEEIIAGLTTIGLDVDEFTTSKLKPLTYVEKLVGKGKLAPFLSATSPKPVICDISDERPAVKNLMEMLADEINEEEEV